MTTGTPRCKSTDNILGVKYNFIDCQEVLHHIETWRRERQRRFITLTPAISVMLCRRDSSVLRATQRASLVLPDSIGVIVAAKLLGYKTSGRVAGPALMLKLCDWGRRRGYRHFFYGGGLNVAEQLAFRLSEKYPGIAIAGTLAPPFRELSLQEDDEIISTINATTPDIVWVGLGTPKQELWMANHVGRISAAVLIGVGAAFDFHSGSRAWAPKWIRAIGLEWVYRLATEPKRWRRFLSLPNFAVSVLRQRLTGSF